MTVNPISLANLKKVEKGDPAVGRPKGSSSKYSALMKKAMVLAAGRSKHSAKTGKDLEAYLLFLANDYPPVFALMLTRLITEPAKQRPDDEQRFGDTVINLNMPVSNMVNVFEERVRGTYMPKLVEPVVIDHEDA